MPDHAFVKQRLADLRSGRASEALKKEAHRFGLTFSKIGREPSRACLKTRSPAELGRLELTSEVLDEDGEVNDRLEALPELFVSG